MNNFNFSDCRKAVNQATFRPTAERKALAIKLLQEALDAVTSLEEVKDKPSKKAGKKRRRRKTASPQQRVADNQEKAFHGKADGVVTPSKKGAKTASVEEAQASLKEMDAKNTAKKAAKLKAKKQAKLEAKRVASGVSEADRVASLEAKVEALTATLAVHMESTTLPSPSNETLDYNFDDMPF